ncbi:hypothetical protein CEXT_559271 [Caerostris extrusa]|uniref:Uncharacterized protein n=1 Tax=Caerostris extrusa TaxID=172846 RepID=A0AAV4UVF0_CAEEX|nr:hypothetical protein CEXT_559271 [Caerostris extrusa]
MILTFLAPQLSHKNSASTIDFSLTKNIFYPYEMRSMPEHSTDNNPVKLRLNFSYSTTDDRYSILIDSTCVTILIGHLIKIQNSPSWSLTQRTRLIKP